MLMQMLAYKMNSHIVCYLYYPPGFYDTSEEQFDPLNPNFKRLRQQNLDGERRDAKEEVTLNFLNSFSRRSIYY